jgi:hypothetical protein
MRRHLPDEPFSRAALWSLRLVLFAMALAITGMILGRSPRISELAFVVIMGAVLCCVLLSLALVLRAAIIIWYRGQRGAGTVLLALLLGLALLIWPGFLALHYKTLPPIHDVATDLVDVPPFLPLPAAAGAVRPSHPLSKPAEQEAQRRQWPDIQPVLLDMALPDAWALVEETATAMGWRILWQEPPLVEQGKLIRLGRIEAMARSPLTTLIQDITIRVRGFNNHVQVDMRAASRLPLHDLGTNARRIQDFTAALQHHLDAREQDEAGGM